MSTTRTTTTPPTPAWINGAEAAQLACRSTRVIRDAARRGLIASHEVPGVKPLYLRRDVAKFIPPPVDGD